MTKDHIPLHYKATTIVVEMKTRRFDFSPNLESVKIEDVTLYFRRKQGEIFELTNLNLFFTQTGVSGLSGGDGNTENGIINSRRAGKWVT